MRQYHPLDTRHKANKAGPNQASGKPWRHVVDPPPAPGARAGPIRDGDALERRAREKIGKEAEQAALNEAPLSANLFGPAILYYEIRAALIGDRARGYGTGRIALNIACAFLLYFLLIFLDRQFGLAELASGAASMLTID